MVKTSVMTCCKYVPLTCLGYLDQCAAQTGQFLFVLNPQTSKKDRLINGMYHLPCCLISDVCGCSKKRKKCGASSVHITNLKQSILYFLLISMVASPKVAKASICWHFHLKISHTFCQCKHTFILVLFPWLATLWTVP
jgi:hypothetical protein